MSAHVTVDRHDDRMVAGKRRPGPDGARDLVHELALLSLACHPGVVAPVALREDPDGPTLLTQWVGGRTLDASHRLDPVELASVLAAVATTVADLHDLGLVHGALDQPSHVLLDGQGRPVLCGFGSARTVPADDAAADARAQDVAGLGTLVIRVLDGPDGIEAAETVGRRRGRHADRGVRQALYALGEQARAQDPNRRPTARALARSFGDLAPRPRFPAGAAAPRPADPIERLRATVPDDPTSRPRLRRLVAGIGVLCAGVLALGLGWGLTGTSTAPPAAAGTAGTARSIGSTTSDEDRSPQPPRPTTTEAAAAVDPAQGAPTVEHDGRTYRLGQDGDVATVATWHCGDPVAVLLRPDTGEIYAFPGWAQTNREVTGVPVDRAAPGAALDRHLDGAGCPVAVVRETDGTTRPLDLRPLAEEGAP